MRTGWGVFFLAVVLRATAAAAQSLPEQMRLKYTLGRDAMACPPEQVLRDAVGAQMTRDPFASPDAAAQLAVTITREDRRYHAHVELRDGEGKLLWNSDLTPLASCQSIVEDLGLTISVKLEPTPTLQAAPQNAPPPARIEAPPKPTARTAPAPKPFTPGEPVVLRLGTTAGAQFGTAPTAAAAFGVDFGLGWKFLSGAIEARGIAPATGDVNGKHIRTSLIGGAIVPCVHWRKALGFVCPELMLASMQAADLLVGHPAPGTVFYAAAGGQVGIEVPVSSYVALRVAGEVLGAIEPPRFLVGTSPEYIASPVVGRVVAGVLFSFGRKEGDR